MRNPCLTCENSLLDKNECALGCERRHEYCERLEIPFGRSTKSAPAAFVFSPPKSPKPDWSAPKGMRLKGEQLEKAMICIQEGKGIKETSRFVGIHRKTVRKLRKILKCTPY
jgi:hypothetical protein